MNSIYDHYLPEDREQLDANLLIMHKALINIIESTTKADFKVSRDSFIQFSKSYQIIEALHLKKSQRSENEINEYMRRHFF